MNCKKIFICIFSIFLLNSIVNAAKESLPNGYGGVELGISMEEAKKAIQNNPDFGYRGDRDVSLLPGEDRSIIETDTDKGYAVYSFLSRCWFQFYKDKLYIITINMKTDKMDHYSVFSTLCQKYGNPDTLNPEKSEWINDSVIMSLERPLTLKYTDKKVFDKLMEESLVNKSASENSRDNFLKGL